MLRKLILISILCFNTINVDAAVRNTEDLDDVVYQCSVIPSLATPVWDLAVPTESWIVSNGQVIDINTLQTGASCGYWLPGQWGTEYAADPNNRHYTYGNAANPWNPNYTLGYTVEVSTKAIDTYRSSWAYCYDLMFTEDFNEASVVFSIFEDRITAAVGPNGIQTVLYIGDLTTTQHKLRFVRYPGNVQNPNHNPRIALYVDGILEYTGGVYSYDGDGSLLYCDSDPDKRVDVAYMGGISGSSDFHVQTDYIRMDFTGAYEPPSATEDSLSNYAETYAVSSYGTMYSAAESVGPSVVSAPNGDLVCSFSNVGDGGPGCTIQFTRSTNQGQTWTYDSSLVFQSSYGANGGISGYLGNDASGNIILATMDANGPVSSQRTGNISVYRSTDNGHSFSLLAGNIADSSHLNVVGGGLLIAANGDWILPGYYFRYHTPAGSEPDLYTHSGFWRSTNAGQNWTFETIFEDGVENSLVDYYCFNEIDIVKRSDNSLLAVCRTDMISGVPGKDTWGAPPVSGVLYWSISVDNGTTWTRPRSTGIAAHAPALITWRNNDAVMLGCRRFTSSGNKTAVYICPDMSSDDPNEIHFFHAMDASEPRGNRTSATGYPTFVELNNANILMAFYAGDSTLSWPSGTYMAWNKIHQTLPFTYSYDADQLPSAATPAYMYASGTPKTTESSAASVSSGILTIDTDTDGADSDAAYYILNGGSGTDWDPAAVGPFAIEVRMKSLANNSSTYNAFFEWFDGNSSILLQVWSNKVSLNGTVVSSLNNTEFHTYRIVSEQYGSSTDQRFDLYRDDVLIINDAANSVNYYSPRFRFGDMTGTGEVNVSVDYIRWHDDSNSITGYNYSFEAAELPSAASPAYAYGSSYTNAAENEAVSSSSGVLSIDTQTDGADSDSAFYLLPGGTGTSWWNPSALGPFTIETRMRSFANNSGTYNAWLEWFDGNSSILLQVWSNKVSLNGSEVTGLDNTAFHTYRIVSYQYDSSANQRFDLYRDGVLIINDASNSVNYYSPRFRLGDMTGIGEVDVDIDYIRWSDNIAIEP